MTRKGPLPAKLMPPTLPKIVPRPRLFRELDRARKRPIVWITAPPGAGKTTLVASYLKARKLSCLWYQVDEGDVDPATLFYYLRLAGQQRGHRRGSSLPLLTPEYRPGLMVYAKRFFEALCARLSTPAAVVFDNFQLLPVESQTHAALAAAFEAIPLGITVFVVSRQPTPPMVASLQVQQRIALITDEMLRVTESEASGIRRLHLPRSRTAITRAQMHQWYEQSHGWMAGLILLAGAVQKTTRSADSSDSRPPQVLFDYLAREVMERFEPTTQRVLRTTAFAPTVTGHMASLLSGVPDAEARLKQLSHAAYFTEQRNGDGPTYQYHPLFRQFLQAQTNVLSEATSLRRRTAELLEQEGQTDQAMDLYLEAQEWTEAMRLVLGQAPLLMQQGRLETLARWILTLPQDYVETNPWLSYWLGNALMFHEADRALVLYEQALAAFIAQRITDGEILTLSNRIVLIVSLGIAWERLPGYVEALLETTADGTQWPSPTVEIYATMSVMAALVIQEKSIPRLQRWLARACRLLDRMPTVHSYGLAIHGLMIALLWEGRLDAAAAMVARLRSDIAGAKDVSPIDQVSLSLCEAAIYWRKGQPEACRREVERLLTVSSAHGIYLHVPLALAYGAHSSLVDRNVQQLRDLVGRAVQYMAKAPNAFSQLFTAHLAAAMAVMDGDLTTARRWCLTLTEHPLVGVSAWPTVQGAQDRAYVEWLAHNDTEAWYWVSRALEFVDHPMPWSLRRQIVMLACAITARQGRDGEADEFLRQAMTAPITHDPFIPDFPMWDIFALCCSMALEADLEAYDTRELIHRLKLVPPADVRMSRAWPWVIKISTLGKSEILVNDRPLQYGRKIPRMPLMLLQAIIVHGGSEVSTETLCDLLWPDSEGDAAYRALMMALSRLRMLLKYKDAIVLKDNRLLLNPSLCWVDALAFEQLAKDALLLMEKGKQEKGEALAKQARALYAGEFVPTADYLPWTHPFRDRLVRTATRLGIGAPVSNSLLTEI